MTDELIKLWDRGGSAIVLFALVGLLLRFMLGRAVKALDDASKVQSESSKLIADALDRHTAEITRGLSSLTERVSRVEGKVEGFGMAAVRAARSSSVPPNLPASVRARARQAAEASVEEILDGDTTGQHEIPTEFAPALAEEKQHALPPITKPTKQTPPHGYRPPARPPTQKG